MAELIRLLKESFELSVKMRWLKNIEKESDKYTKIKSKLTRQQHCVNALLEEYKKRYSEDLRRGKDNG
jgi:transcription initiation factor TFIIIB Brf1 subunit/transcription initiation factor TFIIB